MIGFYGGLFLTMWIGIGAQVYKPVYTRIPPVSVDQCGPAYNVSVAPPADKDYG